MNKLICCSVFTITTEINNTTWQLDSYQLIFISLSLSQLTFTISHVQDATYTM